MDFDKFTDFDWGNGSISVNGVNSPPNRSPRFFPGALANGLGINYLFAVPSKAPAPQRLITSTEESRRMGNGRSAWIPV